MNTDSIADSIIGSTAKLFIEKYPLTEEILAFCSNLSVGYTELFSRPIASNFVKKGLTKRTALKNVEPVFFA